MKKSIIAIKKLIIDVLEDHQALDIVTLDVKKVSDFADYIIISTGKSTTQNKAMADKVVRRLREEGLRPLGVEGETTRDWILVDFGAVVLHIMLASSREAYNLEKLWNNITPKGRAPRKKPNEKSPRSTKKS